MRFTTVFLAACTAAMASAQAYFTMSTLPSDIAPGTNYDITWLNGQGTSTVTIFLVQGDSQNLKTIMSIASGQSHNGTLSWSPSASLSKASNYAFKIVDDSNPNNYNYSGQFAIVTSITASNTQSIASTAGSATTTGTTTSASASGITTLTGSSTSATGSSTSRGSSTSASSGTTTRASTSTTSSPATTANVNAARSVKVGGGLLAAVAGVMIAL